MDLFTIAFQYFLYFSFCGQKVFSEFSESSGDQPDSYMDLFNLEPLVQRSPPLCNNFFEDLLAALAQVSPMTDESLGNIPQSLEKDPWGSFDPDVVMHEFEHSENYFNEEAPRDDMDQDVPMEERSSRMNTNVQSQALDRGSSTELNDCKRYFHEVEVVPTEGNLGIAQEFAMYYMRFQDKEIDRSLYIHILSCLRIVAFARFESLTAGQQTAMFSAAQTKFRFSKLTLSQCWAMLDTPLIKRMYLQALNTRELKQYVFQQTVKVLEYHFVIDFVNGGKAQVDHILRCLDHFQAELKPLEFIVPDDDKKIEDSLTYKIKRNRCTEYLEINGNKESIRKSLTLGQFKRYTASHIKHFLALLSKLKLNPAYDSRFDFLTEEMKKCSENLRKFYFSDEKRRLRS